MDIVDAFREINGSVGEKNEAPAAWDWVSLVAIYERPISSVQAITTAAWFSTSAPYDAASTRIHVASNMAFPIRDL